MLARPQDGLHKIAKHADHSLHKADLTMAGCAIIEAICSFWPISEITIADRGIREGILLDMMHNKNNHNNFRSKRKDEKNATTANSINTKRLSIH